MVIIDTHLIPCAELQFMDNAVEDYFAVDFDVFMDC